MVDKKDLSEGCNKDDEDQNNNCWDCSYFCFPVGCMYYERGENTPAKTMLDKGEIGQNGKNGQTGNNSPVQ